MSDETNLQPQWAIVELMGHVRYGGRVSKDTILGTPMLRVDVPQHDGSFATQLVNPTSIYRITMCAEEIARQAAKAGKPEPMYQWELKHLLPEPARGSVSSGPRPGEPGGDDDDFGDEDGGGR